MSAQQVFKATSIVLLTVLCAYIVVTSLRILVILLIAVIIASAVRPLVVRLGKWRVPQGVAIGVIYLGIASFIIAVAVALLPPIVNQFTNYVENDSRLATRIIIAQLWVERSISDFTNNDVSLVDSEQIRSAVSEFAAQVRQTMPNLVDDLGNTIADSVLIFVMGAYWLTSYKSATEYLTQLSPPRYRDNVYKMIDEIELTMGSYVRGVVTIASIVGILNFIPMQLLGVPNALTLSFIIAITTTIPMIGGFIGGITTVFLTLITNTEYVFIVFAIFFIVQQIENYLLSPRIMSHHVHLDPILVIVYTSIGFVMGGITGALIVVPIMGTVHILLKYLVIEPYKERMQSVKMENGEMVIEPVNSTKSPNMEGN